MNSPTTKKEAKNAWKYTKSVLSREAKKAFRAREIWGTSANGVHFVVSGDHEWIIAFAKNEHGHVFGFDLFAYMPQLPRGEGAEEWLDNPQLHN